MVTVKFERTDDGKTLIMSVQGHAQQAEKGKDIVCASVSFMSYTVAQNVSDMFSLNALKKKPSVRLNEGDAVITCKPKKDTYAEAFHIFLMAQRGLELLAAGYPEHIKLIKFDSGKSASK